MSLEEEILGTIGQPESGSLEYKSVLPPARNVAQIICSFANADGGLLILGVSEISGKPKVTGLSEDFHANAIVHKAIDMLSPRPVVNYLYVAVKDKQVYAIKVKKSESIILLEGKTYKRIGDKTQLLDPTTLSFRKNGFQRIKDINGDLEKYKAVSTNSKFKVFEHYQSVLKIIDDLGAILYPKNTKTNTDNAEGKILTRILFSSFVDNFETYLSDLLYEIFLANPSTLKSQQTVTIEEVFNCSDLQEFIKYWAKQKIGKLQKGSVKGFIKDNPQINELGIIDKLAQNDIEKILQIRHLYSHRNGIVDEKFLQYFVGEFEINKEHQMSIELVCDKLIYLSGIIEQIDTASIKKYKLAVISS